MSEYDELFNAIDIIVNKKLGSIGCNYYVDGKIVSAQTGSYTVNINGQEYTGIKAKTGLPTYVAGNTVQICVKNGDFSRKFIDDKMLV